MLTGKFTYQGRTYTLNGYDFEENIALILTAQINADRYFIDAGVEHGGDVDVPAWDELYVSIGPGNVSVQSTTLKEDGVTYRSSLNRAFFERLGSILRGMKAACNRSNQEGSEYSYNTTFELNKNIKYIIGDKGYVVLDMRTLIEISYQGEDGTSLYLEEDGSYALQIFPPKGMQKFKLDLSEFIEEEEDDDWDFGTDDTVFSLAEIIERNPHKNYTWLKKRKYFIVNDIKEIERICQQIWRHPGIVAFDTETTGLRVNITSRTGDGDRLVGMVFSIQPGIAWYFPVAHKKVKNFCTPGNEKYLIEKYFKPILEKKRILCHNGPFDWKVMYTYDICVNLCEDTRILYKVTVWNDHRSMSLSLKHLTHEFLCRDSFELSDFVKGKFGSNNVTFADFEEESVKYYACPDTDNLIELLQYAEDNNLLAKYGARKTYEMEVAFSMVIAYQEYYGHCVDVSKIDALVEDIEKNLSTNYKKMLELVGHDFNPNSSPQLAKIMIGELGYPVMETTDTGNPSTGKDSRKKWMSYKNPDGSDMYPMARYLQDYADHSTLKSNFTANLPKFATKEGLCFSEVQQFLETGRVSVKEPNYQSYSDTVKKYIIPRTGYYAMDADYSSVEARIMVSMAGCKNMVERLKDPDMDYHTAKASDMFGVPYELVSKKLRKMSKGVNFGILYGLGDWNLGVNLYGEGSQENTVRAKHQKELYFKGMEELRDFITKSKAQGTTQFFSTTFFGRRRYYDPRKTRKDRIERQSCNARIQGTAADIYKIAMINLFTELRKQGVLGKILISAFVHDECFLEVHKSLDPCKALKMLRKCMMLEIENWCPLFIGCGFGRNWYEAKKTEIPVQVQDKFINVWGESGLDWWNGDTDRLYEWEVNEINDYRRDRVLDYLKDEKNWGTVFKPTENSLAHEVMDEIKSGVKVHGVVTEDFEIKEDMLENLYEFCKAFGCTDLYEKAQIRKPEHKEQATDTLDVQKELNEGLEVSTEDIIRARIKTIGVHSVRNSKGIKIYFRWDESDPALMKLCYNLVKKHPGNAEVFAVKSDGKFYSTKMSMDVKAFPQLLQMFLQRGSRVKSA